MYCLRIIYSQKHLESQLLKKYQWMMLKKYQYQYQILSEKQNFSITQTWLRYAPQIYPMFRISLHSRKIFFSFFSLLFASLWLLNPIL